MEFVIYGAGNMCKWLLKQIHDLKVVGIIDKACQAKATLAGFPLYPLSEAASLVKGRTVITAVFNRDFCFEDTRKLLHEKGAREVLSLPQAVRRLNLEANFFWLVHPSAATDSTLEARCASLLADDRSRSLLSACFASQRLVDDTVLPIPDARHLEYLPTDIPELADKKHYQSVVDGGACFGETVERFIENRQSQKFLCFEPDPQNFSQLKARAELLRTKYQAVSIETYNYGLWNNEAVLHFDSGKGESSCIGTANTSSSSSSIEIKCVSLSSFASAFAPTLIKLAVEGAEHEVLVGAQPLIEKLRPALILCTYHNPEHLWKLLLTVEGWQLKYRFYLRSYGHCGFDTVLYAVPAP